MRLIFFSIFVFGASASVQANVRPLTLSHQFSLFSPRWMHESELKPKSGQARALMRVKQAKIEKKYSLCAGRAQSALKSVPEVSAWLVNAGLNCLVEAFESGKPTRADRRSLKAWLGRLEAQPLWFLDGAYGSELKRSYIGGLKVLFSQQIRSEKSSAWKTFEKLIGKADWQTDEDLAHVNKMAGELAFSQQRMRRAFEFFGRSLMYKDDKKIRQRLSTIKSAKDIKEVFGKPAAESSTVALKDVESSEGERKLFQRMNTALKSGDLVSATDDGVKLLQRYPGGQQAQWCADRILEIYFNVSSQSEQKFKMLKKRILGQMKKANATHLLRWTKTIFYRGHFEDAAALGERALDLLEGRSDEEDFLVLTAKSLYYVGAYNDSEVYFKRLVDEYAGNLRSHEALFYLGLMNFRKNKMPLASAYFERLIVLGKSSKYYLSSLYWLWRAQTNLGHRPRSKELATRIVMEFPLTYYGLIVQQSLNGGELKWIGKKKFEGQLRFWLTQSERLSWRRATLLAEAGWYNEAQAELSTLPKPKTPEEQVIWAKVLGASFNYSSAFSLVSQAMELKPSILSEDVLKILYPREYQPWVSEWAGKNGMDSNLILALIRQESAFQPSAKSPANAVGLMQVVSVAFKDVQLDLKIKGLSFPQSLYDEETNIRIGTFYLKKMMRSSRQYLPLALASYNGGIGRVRRWFRARKFLATYLKSAPLDLDSEIWVEELPWSETTFYVKAVLRNYLLYSLLEKGKLQVEGPVWKL